MLRDENIQQLLEAAAPVVKKVVLSQLKAKRLGPRPG